MKQTHEETPAVSSEINEENHLREVEALQQEKDDVRPSFGEGIYAGLVEIPREALLDEKALADVFDICIRTVKRMVTRFELPPPIKIRGKSMWVVGRVLDWINSQAELAEREAMKQAQRVRKYSP